MSAVEEMTDEHSLRVMLDESDDFELRRRIRARLRQLKKEASPATEINRQLMKPQQSYLTPDRQKPVKIIETKENQNDRKEFLEKTTNLRSVKINTTNRPVSTTGVVQMESVSLRKPTRSVVDSRRSDSSSSGARLETVVLRKVETKTTKNENPKPRSNAAKITPKAALERFKEMDLNSDAGRRYLDAGGLAARRRSPSPNSIRDRMLDWCRARVSSYEDITMDDFSASWNDGMAFCALVHSFYPEAFDYDTLDRKDKAKNFQLAFDTAERLAGVVPLLDVEDMVRTSTPDWKCVFTYVNSFANRMWEIRKEKKEAEELQREKELGKERPEEEKQEQDQDSDSD